MSNSWQPHGLYSPWNSPSQNTGVGSLSLLQRIFPTQGLNPGLPHCKWILYHLSHRGSPRILEWVAYPFSSGSSWLRNWTRVSCIAGRFFTNWAIRKAKILWKTCELWDSSCPEGTGFHSYTCINLFLAGDIPAWVQGWGFMKLWGGVGIRMWVHYWQGPVVKREDSELKTEGYEICAAELSVKRLSLHNLESLFPLLKRETANPPAWHVIRICSPCKHFISSFTSI